MDALLLHGWAVNSRAYWLPQIKKELLKMGVGVLTPNLPNSKFPKLIDWSKTIIKNISLLKSPKIVIAHSLGGLALLRVLESKKIPLDLVIFVGVPLRAKIKRNFSSPFFKNSCKWGNIKKSIKAAIVIHAKNDRIVNLQNAKSLSKNLKAKLIITDTGGHFISKTFPALKIVLNQEIKKL